jgi:3-phenylpropionate/cinnamic acid dioxygenase small subunit
MRPGDQSIQIAAPEGECVGATLLLSPAMDGETTNEQQIANLLYHYADLVDAAKFDEVGALFSHATYATLRGDQIAKGIRAAVIVYADGTPRTRHVTTNLSIDIDGPTATASSTFVVHQSAPGLALQVIVIGRYDDRFERVDQVWRFTERNIRMDLIGDMSHHLRRPPTPTHLTEEAP